MQRPPPMQQPPPARAEVPGTAPSLPDGWSVFTDATGRTLYGHLRTGWTSWDPPPRESITPPEWMRWRGWDPPATRIDSPTKLTELPDEIGRMLIHPQLAEFPIHPQLAEFLPAGRRLFS